MTATNPTVGHADGQYAGAYAQAPSAPSAPAPRRSTETKASAKTTELMVFLAAVLAVIITALVVGKGDNGGTDPFSALDAIRYISYLTIGYMVARGLAKSGSREHYSEQHDAR